MHFVGNTAALVSGPKNGGYQYAELVKTSTDIEPVAMADTYNGGTVIEVTFCWDKQALGLVMRRQCKWEAQTPSAAIEL